MSTTDPTGVTAKRARESTATGPSRCLEPIRSPNSSPIGSEYRPVQSRVAITAALGLVAALSTAPPLAFAKDGAAVHRDWSEGATLKAFVGSEGLALMRSALAARAQTPKGVSNHAPSTGPAAATEAVAIGREANVQPEPGQSHEAEAAVVRANLLAGMSEFARGLKTIIPEIADRIAVTPEPEPSAMLSTTDFAATLAEARRDTGDVRRLTAEVRRRAEELSERFAAGAQAPGPSLADPSDPLDATGTASASEAVTEARSVQPVVLAAPAVSGPTPTPPVPAGVPLPAQSADAAAVTTVNAMHAKPSDISATARKPLPEFGLMSLGHAAVSVTLPDDAAPPPGTGVEVIEDARPKVTDAASAGASSGAAVALPSQPADGAPVGTVKSRRLTARPLIEPMPLGGPRMGDTGTVAGKDKTRSEPIAEDHLQRARRPAQALGGQPSRTASQQSKTKGAANAKAEAAPTARTASADVPDARDATAPVVGNGWSAWLKPFRFPDQITSHGWITDQGDGEER